MTGTPLSDRDGESEVLLGELAVFFADLYADATRVSLARAILQAAFDAHEDTAAQLDLVRARLRAANSDLSELLAVQAASNASRSPSPSPAVHPKRPASAAAAHSTPLVNDGPHARAPWPSPDTSPERPTAKLRLLRSSVVLSPANPMPARRVMFSVAPAVDELRAERPRSDVLEASTNNASGLENGTMSHTNGSGTSSGSTSRATLDDVPGAPSQDATTAAPALLLLQSPATLLPIGVAADASVPVPAQRRIRQRPRSLQLDLLNVAPPMASEFEDDEPLTPRPRLPSAGAVLRTHIPHVEICSAPSSSAVWADAEIPSVIANTRGPTPAADATSLAFDTLAPLDAVQTHITDIEAALDSKDSAALAGTDAAVTPLTQMDPDEPVLHARVAEREAELASQAEALARTEAALVRAWDRAEQIADARAEMEVELGAVRAERDAVRAELDGVRVERDALHAELARAQLALALRPSEPAPAEQLRSATGCAWLSAGGAESTSRTRQRSMKWVGARDAHALSVSDAVFHAAQLAGQLAEQDLDADSDVELAAAHECIAQLEVGVERAERDARRARADLEAALEERDAAQSERDAARSELERLCVAPRVSDAHGAREDELVTVVAVVVSVHANLRHYKQVVAEERRKSQHASRQLTMTLDELTATQSKLCAAKAELSTAKTELSHAHTELSTTQAELADTQRALIVCDAELDAHSAALHDACIRLVDQGRLLAERDVQIAVLTADWLLARCEAQAARMQQLLW